MEEKTGVIQGVSSKQGISKFNKPYINWTFEIDGHKYSTFAEDIGKSFKVGDYVKMLGEQKGEYWNMVSMQKIDKVDKAIPQKDLNEAGLPIDDGKGSVKEILLNILEELKKFNGNK